MVALTVSDLFGTGRLVVDRDTPSYVTLLRGHRHGQIAIPSGRIVAGDPWSFADLTPLSLRVRPGTYPVVRGAAEMDAGEDGTGLLLRLAARPVVRWESLGRAAVDGATLAFGDAAAARRLPRDWTDRLGAGQRLGRHFAASPIGGDGGYPVRRGLDARDRVVALALTAFDVRKHVGWPRSKTPPPVDLESLDACLAWARTVGGADSLVKPGRLDRETLAALRALARRPIPSELRRYYATHNPWVGEGTSLRTFEEARRAGALDGAFPVEVSSATSLSVMRSDGSIHTLYEGSTMGTSRDLRAWVVLNSISALDLAGG